MAIINEAGTIVAGPTYFSDHDELFAHLLTLEPGDIYSCYMGSGQCQCGNSHTTTGDITQ
jgi:hypothetical protein